MEQITVEASLGEKLISLGRQVVLCDASGRALGFFSPLDSPTPVADLCLEPPLSIAETEELRKNRTGKPLAEILRQLGLE